MLGMTNREIDALVAEKVMGYAKPENVNGEIGFTEHFIGTGTSRFHVLPHYSTEIAAAWKVVERLKEAGWVVEIRTWGASTPQGPKTLATLWKEWTTQGYGRTRPQLMRGDSLQVPGDTAAHAICRAALKSVGVSSPAS